jgi:hypothetical protein
MTEIEKLGVAISNFVRENNLKWSTELREAWEKADSQYVETYCSHEETVVKGSLVHCKVCDYCFGVD